MANLEKTRNPIGLKNVAETEGPDGIFRTTLAFNPDAMLCHFKMTKGSQIPLHNHINGQIGYLISGQIKFLTEDSEFIVNAGDSYAFGPNEKHGADVLENSIAIEVFTPVRPEYKPQ